MGSSVPMPLTNRQDAQSTMDFVRGNIRKLIYCVCPDKSFSYLNNENAIVFLFTMGVFICILKITKVACIHK